MIAQGIARHLEGAGFSPVRVADGKQALARLRFEQPDVCVLDLMLPGLDGWAFIETARGEGIGTPIIVVSARGTEHDRVHALEIGADDYLVEALLDEGARCRIPGGGTPRRPSPRRRAVATRSTRGAEDRPPRGAGIRRRGECGADPPGVQADLHACARAGCRVATRDGLLEDLGRRESHRDRTVDVFVGRLREKIDRRTSSTPSSRLATASATSSAVPEINSQPARTAPPTICGGSPSR